MRFLHAADLHLDSPLRGLDRYEGAPVAQFREATRRALENLVALCLEERVDFILLAGDLYDGNWRDYKTGLFFQAQMARLRAAGVPVVMIRGNHDAESQITRSLRLPENVRELRTGRPESDAKTLERFGVAVHGQGFATKAVTDDLAASYPDALPGLFNIGLLHTSVGGREGHAPYAPCTLDTLRSKGYDYWALGHVHEREVLCEAPWVVFPGNLQGRHARECGAKGATLVTVENGRVRSAEHRALDTVRWARCEVEVAGAAGADEVVDRAREALERAAAAAEGRTLAARVVLRGVTAAHAALQGEPARWSSEIRAAANDVGGEGVWVERVVVETRTPLDLAALAAREDAVGQLVRSLRALRDDQPALRLLADEFGELRHKLPQEVRDGEEGLRLEEPELYRRLLGDVEQLLLPRLLERERSG